MSARFAAIATWDFGRQAVENAATVLDNYEKPANEAVLDAIVQGIEAVERNPNVSSVGYGGLPCAEGVLQLDAAIMLGNGKGGSVSCQYVWMLFWMNVLGHFATRFSRCDTYRSFGFGEKSARLSLWTWRQKVCGTTRFPIRG